MLQLLSCLLLIQPGDPTFDAKNIQRTRQWVTAKIKAVEATGRNPVAQKRAEKALSEELAAVKEQPVEWTYIVLSFKDEGKKLGIYLRFNPGKVLVCSPERAAKDDREAPHFLIPADDEAAALRPGSIVVVRGKLKSLRLTGAPGSYLVIAAIEDASITRARR